MQIRVHAWNWYGGNVLAVKVELSLRRTDWTSWLLLDIGNQERRVGVEPRREKVVTSTREFLGLDDTSLKLREKWIELAEAGCWV